MTFVQLGDTESMGTAAGGDDGSYNYTCVLSALEVGGSARSSCCDLLLRWCSARVSKQSRCCIFQTFSPTIVYPSDNRTQTSNIISYVRVHTYTYPHPTHPIKQNHRATPNPWSSIPIPLAPLYPPSPSPSPLSSPYRLAPPPPSYPSPPSSRRSRSSNSSCAAHKSQQSRPQTNVTERKQKISDARMATHCISLLACVRAPRGTPAPPGPLLPLVLLRQPRLDVREHDGV